MKNTGMHDHVAAGTGGGDGDSSSSNLHSRCGAWKQGHKGSMPICLLALHVLQIIWIWIFVQQFVGCLIFHAVDYTLYESVLEIQGTSRQ